jgi:vancomycin resistance protein VanJ
VYAAVLAALTVLNWSGADRIWLGALNLYLPQVMWAVPGVILAFLIYKTNPLWIWLPLCCVVWVLGPLMGFCWSGPPAATKPAGASVRVMTWNVKYGSYDLAPLIAEIDRSHPDVVLFQDAIDSLSGPLRDYFRTWQVYSQGQYLIASRYPFSTVEVHELPAFGEGQEYLRCQLHLGTSVVSLYNVHLKTPRRSLNAFRTARKQPWYLSQAIQLFNHNVHTRLLQARSVRDAVSRETGPVIVAGDLNSPDASQACAVLRDAGLRDAFAQRGRGYGFTYGHLMFKYRIPWLRISWMRIDHIMASRHFRVERCWTGTGRASDHRPVIADLVLQRP